MIDTGKYDRDGRAKSMSFADKPWVSVYQLKQKKGEHFRSP